MENTTVIQKLQAKKNKKGFTLVELVIVIAILAILAAIAIPVVVSTINSANTSTFKSDAATAGMLLKAAKNEAEGKVSTVYTDATDSTKTYKASEVDVPFSAIANTNGFTADLKKAVGDAKYAMYWDGKDLTVVDTAATDAPTPAPNDAKNPTGYLTSGCSVSKAGKITNLAATYEAVANLTVEPTQGN